MTWLSSVYRASIDVFIGPKILVRTGEASSVPITEGGEQVTSRGGAKSMSLTRQTGGSVRVILLWFIADGGDELRSEVADDDWPIISRRLTVSS